MKIKKSIFIYLKHNTTVWSIMLGRFPKKMIVKTYCTKRAALSCGYARLLCSKDISHGWIEKETHRSSENIAFLRRTDLIELPKNTPHKKNTIFV